MPGCSPTSPCEKVLSSRWSSIAGIVPVSGLAIGLYLAMLVACLYIGPDIPGPVQQMAWTAMLILAGAIVGSAVWFVIVQKWMVGAFCPYCTATHLTGLLVASLIIWRSWVRPHKDQAKSNYCPIRRYSGMGWLVIGLVLAGLLAACQVIPAAGTYKAGQSQQMPLAIDPNTVPLVGPSQARYIVALLFDYKCPHCQQLHLMLDQIVRRYNGSLAFALCPTPLNSKCNPYIPKDIDQYKDSCDLARIGLAVWLARPEALSIFDQWMFTVESGDRWRPRTLEATRAKAVELVGQSSLDRALADPWIQDYLKTCVQIYGSTINGANAVPKLVYGGRWVIPQAYDIDELITILQDSLGIPEP